MAASDQLKPVIDFLKAVQKDVFGRKTMGELGDFAKGVIFKRTKSGFGVNDDRVISPRKIRLKSLSSSYIAQRRKRGVRGSFGSPGRSNLTNTGGLLDSIVVNAQIGGVTLQIPNSRRKDGRINKDIARFVAQQGRPFFALTKDEQTLMLREIQDRIRRTFSKFF